MAALAGVSRRVLAVNPGSSSLKLSVVTVGGTDDEDANRPRPATVAGTADVTATLTDFVASAGMLDAAAVRIVHGGEDFRSSAEVVPALLPQIRALVDLAPLHIPPAVRALELLLDQCSDLPVVACFDTTFHTTIPAAAATYALPEEWRTRWPLRRFGFHGLSHAHAARRAAELMGRSGDLRLRLITCHLGAGASLSAIAGGVSIDTTMGFTPLDGLVMATRPGALDPGVVLWLVERGGVSPAEVADALERRSGLVGLTGTADLSRVLADAAHGEPRAILARDTYVHRLCALIGSMAASLQGVDALVLTGGAGEGSAELRRRACDRLGWLGVTLDPAANEAWSGTDGSVAAPQSRADIIVIRAREDLEMARETAIALGW